MIEGRFDDTRREDLSIGWSVRQLVLSTPDGDDIEICSNNLAAVLELLRKMIG